MIEIVPILRHRARSSFKPSRTLSEQAVVTDNHTPSRATLDSHAIKYYRCKSLTCQGCSSEADSKVCDIRRWPVRQRQRLLPQRAQRSQRTATAKTVLRQPACRHAGDNGLDKRQGHKGRHLFLSHTRFKLTTGFPCARDRGRYNYRGRSTIPACRGRGGLRRGSVS